MQAKARIWGTLFCARLVGSFYSTPTFPEPPTKLPEPTKRASPALLRRSWSDWTPGHTLCIYARRDGRSTRRQYRSAPGNLSALTTRLRLFLRQSILQRATRRALTQMHSRTLRQPVSHSRMPPSSTPENGSPRHRLNRVLDLCIKRR